MVHSKTEHEIIILGSGASGITTALTLQLLGYRTLIIADRLITDSKEEKEDPRFASRYPAASIIPHSVRSDRLPVLFNDSQSIFRLFHQQKADFIRKNTHYEWFDFPVSAPIYQDWMEDFNMLNENGNSSSPLKENPVEQNKKTLHGWSFSCYFVDWPRYAKRLYEWYEESGGQLLRRRVSSCDIESFDTPYIVNCTGARSRELFDDPEDFCYLLGKSLIVEDGPAPDRLSRIISYNFTPGAEIYSHSSGYPVDLYCYPRSTGWVLGGSRLHGHLDNKGRWSGEQWTGRMLSIDKQQIPAPIYEINRELIGQLYDFDIKDYSLRSMSGYRFMRDNPTIGLRLEEDRQYDKHIFHNYGHGGAGVTLSWGCALQIARLVRNHLQPSTSVELTEADAALKTLKGALNELMPVT